MCVWRRVVKGVYVCHPTAMLIELTVVLIVSVHLMGCAWYLIATMQIGFGKCVRE